VSVVYHNVYLHIIQVDAARHSNVEDTLNRQRRDINIKRKVLSDAWQHGTPAHTPEFIEAWGASPLCCEFPTNMRCAVSTLNHSPGKSKNDNQQ